MLVLHITQKGAKMRNRKGISLTVLFFFLNIYFAVNCARRDYRRQNRGFKGYRNVVYKKQRQSSSVDSKRRYEKKKIGFWKKRAYQQLKSNPKMILRLTTAVPKKISKIILPIALGDSDSQ